VFDNSKATGDEIVNDNVTLRDFLIVHPAPLLPKYFQTLIALSFKFKDCETVINTDY
jgi:hypothetical protein